MKPVLLAAFAAFTLGTATSALAEKKEAVDIAASLKGKLVALQGDEVVDAELTGDPEYYVLYHSASW